MTNSIIFQKTGNFWIDNGLVALRRVLLDIQESLNEEGQQYEVEFREVGLQISVVEGDPIVILNKAKDRAVDSYLTETQNSGWIFKDEKFEIYQRTDFRMALKPFFTGKTPSTEGALCVPCDKGHLKKLVTSNYKLKDTKESKKNDKDTSIIIEKVYSIVENDKTIEKDFTVPTSKPDDVGKSGRFMADNEFVQFLDFAIQTVRDKNIKLAGKGFQNTKPKYEIGDSFSENFFTSGKKRCYFSGELLKKVESVSGMDYPFLTGNSGELNFASNLTGKPQISAKYSFISLFSFLSLRYSLKDNNKHYFVLYDSDLQKLSYFYTAIQTDLSNLRNSTYCNFKTEIVGTEYESEGLMNFLISMYEQLKDELKYDEILTKSIFTFSNDGNIFRDVKEYTSLATLFKLFEVYREADLLNYYFNFIRFFYRQFKKNGRDEYDTLFRDKLCRDILNFRSINNTVEGYLSEVKMKDGQGISFLDKLISIYIQNTQANMKTEMVDLCKRVGNSIGRYCRESDDKGILFSIRNSRNRIDFLKVLSDSQFRTQLSYSEEFFKELPDSPQWEEYKSLVSIFAMNSFLYDPSKSSTNSTNSQPVNN
jgi:hypothetical protein